MLDSTTKKNIDDCRDVLVGKVPDPKSQIEQITLALIYKFMDDMDREVVEKFKGKAKFFAPPKKTGDPKADKKLIDYSQYSWRKLFNPALSGAEVLKLYSEALERLQTNPNIPELFRNIFKNAYLPYRDPATLKLFLKHINLFEYSHSEKLGDAFEYLLSVMGSQGDAGQFRTPRHIIDFVTACVNPQKNETVLDPACGTSGFLLSAYKYILNSNPDKKTKRAGGGLSPDEKKKLVSNFTGYDISPDMVRLSLANMFLHQFPTPKIYEYDSLSSDERWNDNFDVILANPPFMTPKGGIRPHKRFGVQANKAEVLFTDYIAEHLTKNGRAGIVVPNGIVATSQTAYAQLRRNLVNDSLIAVISLPSGVFQPYSGVKTSILLLDKKLSKKSEHILFLKVENDGFDLGAQRREHNKNDLPLALEIFEAYKACLNKDEELLDLPDLATLVEKIKVLKNKDVILSGDRYIENKLASTKYNLMPLSEFVVFTQTGLVRNKGEQDKRFKYPYIKMDGITYGGQLELNKLTNVDASENEFEKYNLKKGDFLYNTRNTPDLVGKSSVFNGDENKYLFNNNIMRVRFDSRLDPFFLNYVINTTQYKRELKKFVDGTTSVAAIYPKNYFSIQIPVPPLEIQQQIVNEIEGYQKIIDGSKQIVNNYKPSISIKPEWEMVELGEVCKIINGRAYKQEELLEKGKYRVLRVGNFFTNKSWYYSDLELPDDKYCAKGDLLYAWSASFGPKIWDGEKVIYHYHIWKMIPDTNNILKEYLFFMLGWDTENMKIENTNGSTMLHLTKEGIEKRKIPIPTINEQEQIVKNIKEEIQLIESNKKLIQLFEAKIKNRIAEVWGVEPREEKEEELLVAAEPELIYEKSKKSLKSV